MWNIPRFQPHQRYALITAIAGTFLKHHTPNFGWCRMYPSLEALLSKTHSQLFTETLGSVMRPSLHIEKMLGHACGMGCVNAYYYIVYFLALYLSTSFISQPLLSLASHKPHRAFERIIQRSALFISITLPIYLIVFSYGSIVDAIFPASIIGMAAYLLRRSAPTSGQRRKNLPTWVEILGIAMLCFLADMSRPYAPYVLLLLLGAAAAQRNKRALAGMLAGIILALPYHTIQFQSIGTPLLSNYAGCNLMEVFQAPGTIAPGAMDTTPQITIAERCAFNSNQIKRYIITNPSAAWRDFSSLPRLSRSALPAPFTAWVYQGFPGFSTPEEILQWALWAAFILFLYIPLSFLLTTSFCRATKLGTSSMILLIAASLPFAITITTNGGQEAGRVGLAFILPLVFLACRYNHQALLKNPGLTSTP